MSRIFWIGSVVLALLLAIGTGSYAYLWSGLPKTEGTQSLNGIQKPIDIARDQNGVPHIFAQTDADAFFALGFVHAQDRLWQMEVNRRIGQGRLSEVFGEKALETDRFIRTLGLYRRSQADFAFLDPATQHMLIQYAKGVNAYLNSRTGALPPEFILLNVKPTPWQPADSMVWLKLMALDLGYQWKTELNRFRLFSRLTPQQVADFYPSYPGESPHDFSKIAALYAQLPNFRYQGTGHIIEPNESGKGSNNWVVSGARTKTGKPLLANDPHLTLTTPSVWYLAHISVAGHNIVGATMPGLPFVTLGRNDKIAWGFTNTAPDAHDLIIERFHDNKHTVYDTTKGPKALFSRTEKIGIRGKFPLKITIRETVNGPVISDAFPELSKALGSNYGLSLRWTGLAPGDTTIAAGRALSYATSPSDLVASLRSFVAPQQNIVYADTDGNIGYIAPGNVPIRNRENPTQGLMPTPGWDAYSQWQGYIPFEQLPRIENPPSGFIATANQKIVGPDYSYSITRDWEPPYRYNRIVKLLQKTPKHDINSFLAIQSDAQDNSMLDIAHDLLALGDYKQSNPNVLSMLKRWTGEMTGGTPEPLIIAAWDKAFEKRLYEDDLGPLFKELWRPRSNFLNRILHDNPESAEQWCDDRRTRRVETCYQQSERALADALHGLQSAYGANVQKWRWDQALRVTQKHRPMSEVSVLKQWFEIVIPRGGGPNSPNVAHFNLSDENTYTSTLGPSYRAIYDLSNLDNSRYIIPTGQSGHPLSRHYRDFAPLWADTRYIKIKTKRDSLNAEGAKFLHLIPQ